MIYRGVVIIEFDQLLLIFTAIHHPLHIPTTALFLDLEELGRFNLSHTGMTVKYHPATYNEVEYCRKYDRCLFYHLHLYKVTKTLVICCNNK